VIVEVRQVRSVETAGRATPLVASLDGNPNVHVSLSERVVARGPLGITRTITEFAVGVDDPEAFVAALRT